MSKKRNRKDTKRPVAPEVDKHTGVDKAVTQTAEQRVGGGGRASGIDKGAFTVLLERATVCYIALPAFIFILGHLRPVWSLPCAVLLLAAVWFYFKNSAKFPPGERTSDLIPLPSVISFRHIALCLFVAFAVSSLFGAGGWGYQTYDWHKHNAMLQYLTIEDWPVRIEAEGAWHTLVYYTGYYLPASLAGKLFGMPVANQALFVWTVLSVFLSLLWMFVFSRTTAKWIIVLFFLFSGLDLVGAFISGGKRNVLGAEADFFYHLEWWSKVPGPAKQIPSNLVGINWLPQHALSSWLITALLMNDIARGNSVRRCVFLASIGILWSVMTAFGVAVFSALWWFMKIREPGEWRRPLTAVENLCVLPFLFCILAYLRSGEYTREFEFLSGERALFFPLFVLLEFGLLWGVIFAANRRLKIDKGWSLLGEDMERMFLISLLALCALFWLEDGDIQKNSSILFMFILMLAAVRMLESRELIESSEGFRRMAGFVIVLLSVGAWTPFVEINTTFKMIHERGSWRTEVKPESMVNNPYIATRQYLGNLDSFFSRHIARRRGGGEARP
ncbi:MAG: hypothetical protein OXF52_02555 [Candidatus Dadabacteria bacterium]|nr:hypothetical protein [Candidatus Dadabacteria bacterium]